MSRQASVDQVANHLVVNKGKEIDIDRELSFGKGAAKTFIDERRGAPTMNFILSNDTDSIVKIAIAPRFNHQFLSDVALLAAVGADHVLEDGEIIAHTDDEGPFLAGSLDSGRTLEEFVRYCSNSPTRFTSWSLTSSKTTDNSPEVSNYNNSLKFVWVSPFRKSEDTFLPLRKFQSARANSPEYAAIDFLKEGVDAIVSAEHIIVVQINPRTALTFSTDIGAQDSRPQRFYRKVKAADSTLAPLREYADKCDC